MSVLLAGLLVVNVFTVGAFLWMLRDQGRQHATQLAERDAAHCEQTMHLLNRIQAPSVAIAQATEVSGDRPYIPPFDDELLASYEDDGRREVPPEELRVGD